MQRDDERRDDARGPGDPGVAGGDDEKVQGETMALVPVAKNVATGLPETWETVIGTLRAERDRMARDILMYRFATGILARDVSDERGKPDEERRFPGHTIHDIAVEIQESDSTVYSCMKFAAQTSPEQLEHMIAEGWAWRAACALVTVEDSKVRKQLQLDYEADKFASTDHFKEVVRDVNEEANLGRSRKKVETDKRAKRSFGGRYVKGKIKSFVTGSDKFLSTYVPDLLAGLKEYGARRDRVVPVTAENIDALIAESEDNVDVLMKRLGDVKVAINKLGAARARAKVKSEG